MAIAMFVIVVAAFANRDVRRSIPRATEAAAAALTCRTGGRAGYTLGNGPDQRESRVVHRVGHPRDDAARDSSRRRQPGAGLSRLPGARRRSRRRRARRSTADVNQYAITWGARAAARGDRRASSRAATAWTVDPDEQVTVCCGATEAMIATMLALHRSRRRGHRLRALLRELRPGRDPLRRRAALRHAARARTGRFDPDELARGVQRRGPARSSSTRRNNPTGKVFTRDELELIADAVPASTTRSRSPTRSTSTSSTTAASTSRSRRSPGWPSAPSRSTACRRPTRVTGWRVGWAIAPPALTGGDPQGARLPDRRRAGAAPGGGGRRAGAARRLLRALAADYQRAPRRCCRTLDAAGFRASRPTARTT